MNSRRNGKSKPSIRTFWVRLSYFTVIFFALIIIGIIFLERPNVFSASGIIYFLVGISALLALLQWFFPLKSLASVEREAPDHIVQQTGPFEDQDNLITIQKEQMLRLELQIEQLEVEKEKLRLDQQRESIDWQKEALMLTEVSPRAAIIIAWLGFEKEVQHAYMRLDGTKEFPFSSLLHSRDSIGNLGNLEVLSMSRLIDPETVKLLSRMRNLRNQIVQGGFEEDITREMAIDFVRNTINITQQLSSRVNSLPS